jgi:class 3 adenylate cyclase
VAADLICIIRFGSEYATVGHVSSVEHSTDGRTLMAAVLFADLVGYSKKSVTQQMSLKEDFRELVQTALSRIAEPQRIILDTGDGAAIAFLADPEHALYCALRLHHLVRSSGPQGITPADVRLGINLGPVRRSVDVNGRPNLVGEGINSAERVMSFSAAGEITASRSFRDAVSCLHESYQHLFEALGQRADKHGRQHEIYRVALAAAALEAATASLGPEAIPDDPAKAVDMSVAKPRAAARGLALAAASAALIGTGVWAWSLREQFDAPDRPQTSSSAQPVPVAPPQPATAGAAVEESRERVPALTASESPEPPPQEASPAPAFAPTSPSRAPKARKPDAAIAPAHSQRCVSLIQRGALERLSNAEQEELRTSCP